MVIRLRFEWMAKGRNQPVDLTDGSAAIGRSPALGPRSHRRIQVLKFSTS